MLNTIACFPVFLFYRKLVNKINHFGLGKIDYYKLFIDNQSIIIVKEKNIQSSPQSCVKVQPHQKHNVLRCEPNCHAFLSEEKGQEQ